MKKIILLLVLLFGGAFAANNQNALGLFFYSGGGGLDYKRLMGNSNALDIYFGGAPAFGSRETKINVDAGYYFLFNVIKADPSVGTFPLHAGPNVGFHWSSWSDKQKKIAGYDGFDIGASVAGGISWFTPTTPKMDISLELVSGPVINLWNHKQGKDDREWELRFFNVGDIGFRLLFHVYFF
jgi:hypothetical protein